MPGGLCCSLTRLSGGTDAHPKATYKLEPGPGHSIARTFNNSVSSGPWGARATGKRQDHIKRKMQPKNFLQSTKFLTRSQSTHKRGPSPVAGSGDGAHSKGRAPGGAVHAGTKAPSPTIELALPEDM